MSNVIPFRPKTKITEKSPIEILEDSKELQLTEVIVIGFTADNKLHIRCSDMTRAEANWYLDMAKAENFYPED